MITTPSSQKRDTTIELTSLEEIRKEIHTNRDEVNITDGGEFLDVPYERWINRLGN